MEPAVMASGGKTVVAFAWEHEPGVSKLQIIGAAGVQATKPPPAAEEAGERTTKAALPHRIRVRPPPGAPAARSRRGVVRAGEDPFLAAFLACTERGKAREPKGAQKLLGWAGLGLSCKGPGGVVESVVRLATMAELKNA